MKTKQRIADFGMRNAERKSRSIRNPQSVIRNSHNSQVIEAAARYLVGGVNSPVRAVRQVGGEPIVLTQANGAEVRDTQGRRFIDFIMGWGALILGHNDSVIVRAITQAATRGTLLGLTHPGEIELARLISGMRGHIPGCRGFVVWLLLL